MPLFGACFIGKTSAIPDAAFLQVDHMHWVLDVSSTVTQNHADLKEICVFLVIANSLPSDAALGVYVSVGGSDWVFRGFISNDRPSETVPLMWPEPPGHGVAGSPGWAQIGVSVEPRAEASAKEGVKLGAKEDLCKRVGLDLFNFMQSFGDVSTVGPDKLLVPANVLDQWYNRISSRLRRDPDFLTRQKDIV